MIKIVVLGSGEGTNLQAIADNCSNGVINGQVVHIISNKKNSGVLKRARNMNISHIYFDYNNKKTTREKYNTLLANHLKNIEYDLIVLAGWMLLLTKEFLDNIKGPIINLHPALPGQFPGKNAIEGAWKSYEDGKISKTGIMVHHVVKEMDAGSVIEMMEIPIHKEDTFEKLKERIRYFEKFILVKAIQKLSTELTTKTLAGIPLVYSGKVREVYDLGYNVLAMVGTDRQSAFDRQICTIPNKGEILTMASVWWFNKTKHIVPNHYLYHYGDTMIVKKCKRYDVEVVVRGYITGSTSTSLWTHYNNGEREYCGIQFPDGLKKNQKLNHTYP